MNKFEYYEMEWRKQQQGENSINAFLIDEHTKAVSILLSLTPLCFVAFQLTPKMECNANNMAYY